VNNIVLVHGLNMDGGAWPAVHDRLTSDDYDVTVVQLPMTSIADDIAATRRALDAQDVERPRTRPLDMARVRAPQPRSVAYRNAGERHCYATMRTGSRTARR
jgi:hypothetical protein